MRETRQFNAGWELRFNLIMLAECLRYEQHDPARAEAMYRESMELSKAAGDVNEIARNLAYYISGFAIERMQFSESLDCLHEALALAKLTDDVQTELQCLCRIAENLLHLGEVVQASAAVEECMSLVAERLPRITIICQG